MSSSQIFKEKLPNEILFNFLEKICIYNKNCYTINKISFKKGEYHNYFDEFIKLLIPIYHNSKQFYINRKLTYNSFLTIIRQICNHNHIKYTYNMAYNKSNYEIIYYIYTD